MKNKYVPTDTWIHTYIYIYIYLEIYTPITLLLEVLITSRNAPSGHQTPVNVNMCITVVNVSYAADFLPRVILIMLSAADSIESMQ